MALPPPTVMQEPITSPNMSCEGSCTVATESTTKHSTKVNTMSAIAASP